MSESDEINVAFTNLFSSIHQLGLPTESLHCLKSSNAEFVGDLVQKTRSDLITNYNFRERNLIELEALLSKINLQLGMCLPEWDDLKRTHHPDKLKQSLREQIKIQPSGISQNKTSNIDNLCRRINKLDLSVRAVNCLYKLGISNIGDLIQKTQLELIRTPNFGRKSLTEIEQMLNEMNLSLGTTIPNWRNFSEEDLKNKLSDQYEKKETDSTTTILDREIYIRLLLDIDEVDFSVRAANWMKNANIKYVGDLVTCKTSAILRIKNLGRKSIAEIQNILKGMELDLGMKITDWPPSSIEQERELYSKELEGFKKLQIEKTFQNDISSAMNLEDEVARLIELAGNRRNQNIVAMYYGLDGKGGCTLEKVGQQTGITRERVRQIAEKFQKKILRYYNNEIDYFPKINEVLQLINDCTPCVAEKIEATLCESGATRTQFQIEGFTQLMRLMNRRLPYCVVRYKKTRFVVKPNKVNVPKKIIYIARRAVEHWGVVTIPDIVAQTKEKTGQTISSEFVVSVLTAQKEFVWLDKSTGWFWLTSRTRNRLLNYIKKVLSVSSNIDVSSLRAGVGRSHRMKGVSPPRRVLIELCRQLTWCRVENNLIVADPPLNWEEILKDGVIEWAMCSILKQYGPVMRTDDFEKHCKELGVNQNSFFVYLSYSPIIAKYGNGVYGLRGSYVSPGMIDSLKPMRKSQQVLIDFGWTPEGEIWLLYKISQSMIKTGVFSIPASMKNYLQGDYISKAADGSEISKLKIDDYRGWSLSAFFQRRGGEPEDFMSLTFNLSDRTTKIYIGDEDLIDSFKPM